ncbi:hypothetical protein K450DRAFT_253371 [Umbelopsis ramanniana AG]|uniref:Uncharacterized protein n=1 Tax=Umbelopsis ramanniana AG TaxID=1314678 RepID=A0AAD5HAL2_UMBRA|nr:uncharacterized protein K450DRAFT_253371 [Umbelopsis ramanniana AG]KAI8577200.1 hypothetical protein K450DRAFT_253371 [Umbelopsis ramanniana AG]
MSCHVHFMDRVYSSVGYPSTTSANNNPTHMEIEHGLPTNSIFPMFDVYYALTTAMLDGTAVIRGRRFIIVFFHVIFFFWA